MKFGIITFPGSNCDHDMHYVLKHILKQETLALWHKENNLQDVDAVVLPGGFSYGDYLRSGAIASLAPIMSAVKAFADQGGIVLGVCNGFQILCESGLLPGALLHNDHQKFICKNQYLRVETTETAFTAQCAKNKVLNIPIAHGEGRFFIDDKGYEDLKQKDQILFRYCNKDGSVGGQANPNGSIDDIAGICNERRNVFGMMPHPERCSDPELRNTDGEILFRSLIDSLSK